MDNFKKLIKEALTPNFLKESVNEDRADKWELYFNETNEYPADTIARVATNINDPEWI